MKNIKKRAMNAGLIGNILLFISKLIVGIVSNSIAIISDAFNSLTDIINSVVLFICVKVGSKTADKEHPFGHYRSEPIGSLIVAVLTVVLGVEITRIAIMRFITKAAPIFSIPILLILVGTIAIKSGLYLYTKDVWKKTKSNALFAFMIDHRNDVIVSFGAIVGFIGVYYNYTFLDPLAAMFIGVWIMKSGMTIGIKNTKYLMGESPEPELIGKISKTVLKVEGVKSIQKIRAHYVGVLLQAEIHIRIDRSISAYSLHTIVTNVRDAVERLREVDKAFVHADPIIKTRPH